MKRSTPLRRKKPIKRVSDRKRREQRETDPIRTAYVKAAQGVCEHCGRKRKLDCHEITAGSSRHLAVNDANSLLAVCRACHEKIQGAPLRYQLACKCLAVTASLNRNIGRQALTFCGVQCAEDSNEVKGL